MTNVSGRHRLNIDRRRFLATGATAAAPLSAIAPASANSAPPGWYLLFLVNTAGVPSVASWVHIG